MPRRPRIDLAGYHHIINRGVARTDVFLEDEDYDIFLGVVCKACKVYRAVVHDYCLMSNHYHLLVETELNNLSLLMKQINSNYAIYFNKKYKRNGHLWQGRYTSRYIVSEAYLYTLIRYIEHNPIEAKMTNQVGEYPYTLCATLLNKQEPISCALHSIVLEQLSYEGIQEMLEVALSDDELKILEEIQKQKTISIDDKRTYAYHKMLTEHFGDIKTKSERNVAIVAALDDGYTQAEIAKYLKLSRSAVSKIVKSVFSTPDPKSEGSREKYDINDLVKQLPENYKAHEEFDTKTGLEEW